MKLFASAAVAALLIASPTLVAAQPKAKPATATAPLPTVDIAHATFKLANGLTVIVHEDHKAPIVAVNIWYHVGSKNEPVGKTGFAHLFEHLMFNGSENFNDDWFKALEKIGATNMNGTTNTDRTNYFENVPKGSLDQVLWLESDRMGHLVGAIDKAKLDEQRGVVQNEKRQGDNQPYNVAWDIITESTYHRDHPYGHSVIGSLADLDSASLDDVKTWFKTYYGPANATLVLAGDITVEEARAKATKYFGDIPSGPPVAKQKVWIAKRTGEQRASVQDRVPQARFYKVWNTPEYGAADADYLDLLSDVLASGKTSRLYTRLVFRDQLATDVSVYSGGDEIGGQFLAMITAKPGVDLAKIEAIFNEELARLLKDGPTPAELAKVKTQHAAGFIRGAERIGGFGGKSDILARNQTYLGDPAAYKTIEARIASATPADLTGAGKRWLTDGGFVLNLTPFPAYSTTAGVDRTKIPAAATSVESRFDSFQRATLSNGMKVMLAERHDTPIVQMSALFRVGPSVQSQARPGLPGMAMAMLDEGTTTRDAQTISRELDENGAQLSLGGGTLYASANLSALKARLDPSLDLFADVLLHPAFHEADLDRIKKLELANLQQIRQDPGSVASRVAGQLVYGPEHPFGRLTTEATINSQTSAEMKAWHDAYLRPQAATLVVVGDTTLAELLPKLEARFGGWKPAAPPAPLTLPTPATAKPAVYLIDKPGAAQSVILATALAPERNTADEPAVELTNRVFGGAFVSRINMNLREDKHWSYGARSGVSGSLGPRQFTTTAPVQTDKTKESLIEMRKELTDLVGARPVTADELAKAQSGLTDSLPGRWEAAAAVQGSLSQIVTLGLPDDYFSTYAANIRAASLADSARVATQIVRPSEMIWVVVGDRAKIEKDIRDLKFGDVIVVDADGKPVK
ncbi:M16 family metallopeptidase [Caulobacter sp.]|uniref:M16 family metallopeptidase n=1 Tax=Caulobacter sp. TaxID=78 RepID=UPI003BAAB80E